MTRLPAEAQRISYAPEGLPKYVLRQTCAHPFCHFRATEGHHVVRRSYTQGVGPQDWIRIDDTILPNRVGLCSMHHQQLTENRALILYKGKTWGWFENDQLVGWLTPLTEGVSLGADALGEREPVAEGASRISRSTDSEGQVDSLPAAGYGVASPAAPVPSEICPTCNRRVPKPKAELQEERPKVSWSIKVPKDARENGYELLRSLVEQCQVELGREGEPPYYVLVEVMHFFLTTPKEQAA